MNDHHAGKLVDRLARLLSRKREAKRRLASELRAHPNVRAAAEKVEAEVKAIAASEGEILEKLGLAGITVVGAASTGSLSWTRSDPNIPPGTPPAPPGTPPGPSPDH